ncbi:MAG: LexA family protein [Dysgonomonas sp.]
MSEVKIKLFFVEKGSDILIPVAEEKFPAGFPKTVSPYAARWVNLSEELIKNPSSTFFGQIEGDSLEDIGLFNDDYFLIDKSITPEDGMLILCVLNGEFTLKFLHITESKEYILLEPANEDYEPIKVNEFIDFRIWGVPTYGIKDLLRNYKFKKIKK